MRTELKLSARTLVNGCGIYQAGETEDCYLRLFVTDGGRAMPVSGISAEDLMIAYEWGHMEAREELGLISVPGAECGVPEPEPEPEYIFDGLDEHRVYDWEYHGDEPNPL
jgi:hypothetical protein